ncbi:MAG: M3 family oligoendopeptidase [Bacteroidota bacterium]
MVATTTQISSPKPAKSPLSIAFKLEQWERLEPIYEELVQRTVRNVKDLEQWILDRNEVSAMVEEEFGWRYIKFTTNANDKAAAKRYEYYIQYISPNISKYDFRLNQKLVESPFLNELDFRTYQIYARSIRNAVELFEESNIKRNAQERLLAKQYGAIMASIEVEIDGKPYTLQQTGALLEQTNRSEREKVFIKANQALLNHREEIDDIYDQLISVRQEIAKAANFDNYRDYKFQELGRFDYKPEDCIAFQDSIKEEILPLLTDVHERKKRGLHLQNLRPWDLAVDEKHDEPLRPFRSVDDLVAKAVKALSAVNPYFGECIQKMQEEEHLDLKARRGKRPGGYNMPLPVKGVPFIFMNVSSSVVDMRTFMHESGHAVHSFLTNEQDLITAKHPPSEIAELAAMSMELLSMDKWHYFFSSEAELKRAKIWLLENILQLLPWIAIIDRFQHWIYANPHHDKAERREKWLEILNDFSTPTMNREGLEEIVAHSWHRQLHLFEVPFYYIEYGMAQLGAIAIWKNYKEKGQAAVEDYIKALKMGYSRPIKEVYAAAGISFDFSKAYVKELAQFLKGEIAALLEE